MENDGPAICIGAYESKAWIGVRKPAALTQALSAGVETPASSWVRGSPVLGPKPGRNFGRRHDYLFGNFSRAEYQKESTGLQQHILRFLSFYLFIELIFKCPTAKLNCVFWASYFLVYTWQ